MNLPASADNGIAPMKGVYRIGAVAALIGVAVMVIQIVIYVVWPPPDTVEGFFALLQENTLLGLLSLDLLYILNNTLLVPIYLALYLAIRRFAPSVTLIALLLGLLGIGAYYASTVAFEMLSLSGAYAAATGEAQRTALLGAGEALLAAYKGSAFDVYYVLNAVILLVFSVVMLRSPVFSRATAVWGLAAGVLMSIPSTAGTIGMIFALASLVPWAVFSLLFSRRLFQLAG